MRSEDPQRIARLTEAGQRLRLARLSAGLLLREVGAACGFSASCLAHYETGGSPISDRQVDRVLAAIESLKAAPR